MLLSSVSYVILNGAQRSEESKTAYQCEVMRFLAALGMTWLDGFDVVIGAVPPFVRQFPLTLTLSHGGERGGRRWFFGLRATTIISTENDANRKSIATRNPKCLTCRSR